MTAEAWAAIANGGSGVVAIAAIVLFLRTIEKRDSQWQSFLHDERIASNGQRKEDRDKIDILAAGLDRLTALMGEFRADFNQHANIEEARFEVLMNAEQRAEVDILASKNVKRAGNR